MALGDGSAWDETTPVDGTTIITGDDHIRDLRIGIRSGMAFEHEWPSSQSATSERGKHKFLTLQNQATKPTVSGTQVAAVYCKTSALYFENTAGTEIQITTGTAVSIADQAVVLTSQLVKAWAVISGSSGAIVTSYNISSVTSASAGIYRVVFNTAFSGTGYCLAGAVKQTSVDNNAGPAVVSIHNTSTAKLTTACIMRVSDNAGVYVPENFNFILIGI